MWFRQEVAHRIRPGARAALERHRQQRDQLVICTSSSIYAGRNAQEVFGLDDTVATVFEVVDGRFTGAIAASALGEEKAHRAEAWAAERGIRLEDCFFYTDSVTDLALLERVGHPVVVNPDRALSRIARSRVWSVEDWGVHQ